MLGTATAQQWRRTATAALHSLALARTWEGAVFAQYAIAWAVIIGACQTQIICRIYAIAVFLCGIAAAWLCI